MFPCWRTHRRFKFVCDFFVLSHTDHGAASHAVHGAAFGQTIGYDYENIGRKIIKQREKFPVFRFVSCVVQISDVYQER